MAFACNKKDQTNKANPYVWPYSLVLPATYSYNPNIFIELKLSHLPLSVKRFLITLDKKTQTAQNNAKK